MKNSLVILILTIVSLSSCDNYKEIKNEKLKSAFIVNSSPNFEGYYFKGSDKDFHYFESKWNFQRNRFFKMRIDKFLISSKYEFQFGENELRIDLFKENNELFGQNEFYRLYVVKTN